LWWNCQLLGAIRWTSRTVDVAVEVAESVRIWLPCAFPVGKVCHPSAFEAKTIDEASRAMGLWDNHRLP